MYWIILFGWVVIGIEQSILFLFFTFSEILEVGKSQQTQIQRIRFKFIVLV